MCRSLQLVLVGAGRSTDESGVTKGAGLCA
jgi:hypothetical protein